MRSTKQEKELLKFLIEHTDQWHTYANDSKTLRSIAGLYLYKGLGIRGFKLSKQTHQMMLDSKIFGLKVIK